MRKTQLSKLCIGIFILADILNRHCSRTGSEAGFVKSDIGNLLSRLDSISRRWLLVSFLLGFLLSFVDPLSLALSLKVNRQTSSLFRSGVKMPVKELRNLRLG